MSKPKKKKLRIWCSGGNKELWEPKTKYVRCDVCDQRFEAYSKDQALYVPPHKAY